MDFCSILKLARVDVGNVIKKGKNMKGIITWSVFARWFLTKLRVNMMNKPTRRHHPTSKKHVVLLGVTKE